MTDENHDLYHACVKEMLQMVNKEEFPNYSIEELNRAVNRDLHGITIGVRFTDLFWQHVDSLYAQGAYAIWGEDETEKHFYNSEIYLEKVMTTPRSQQE